MSMKALLLEEVQKELKELSRMELGTDTYKTTVDGITKLADRVIEIDNFSIEQAEKINSREIETDLKLTQMREDRRDRHICHVITIGTTVLSVVITVWGTVKSINFEKEGTITTIMGREFIKKLLPKR